MPQTARHSPMTTPLQPALARRLDGVPSSAVRDVLQFASRPGVLSLAGGMPAPALLDHEGIAAATQRVLAERGAQALQYGATEGQPALREQLARLMRARGADIDGGQVLVTGGSQQALDLIARTLLDPGDTVAVENPTYLAALQVFALAECAFLTLDGDQDGARIDALVDGRMPKPRLVYLVPTFGNPGATVLSLERRMQLLAWAARERVWLLEDDPYGELRYSGSRVPSLLALACEVPGAEDIVIHVSSLSKIMSPGLRIGWIVAPRALLPALVRSKQALDLQTGSLAQEIAAQWLADDRLPQTLTRMRVGYLDRRDALVAALRTQFGDRLAYRVPPGGMFVWAHFTDGRDTAALLPQALAEGVAFVPGQAFSAGPSARDNCRDAMRLGFATLAPTQYSEAVARLRRACRVPA